MANQIQSISLNKLVAHPGNPNRMSKANFAKLVRNIERTGRYEPLVVRPAPAEGDCFQIINGHHRRRALQELSYETADAVVWDIDDKDADILLATLNRLGGSDVLDKKLALLKRLNQRMEVRELAKLLPQTAKQIHRLTQMQNGRLSQIERDKSVKSVFANPLVFFINDKQQEIIENAVSLAKTQMTQIQKTNSTDNLCNPHKSVKSVETKAAKRAAALTYIAQQFLTLPTKK